MIVTVGKEPVAVISCRWDPGGSTTGDILRFHYWGKGFRQREWEAPRDQNITRDRGGAEALDP